MAPRGHPRKGQRRIDAALDAMRKYGFTDELILSKIKELLKVYGKDGWPFIEDNSYGVLLEVILEKEKLENEGMDQGESLQLGGEGGSNTMALAIGLSEVPASTSPCLEASAAFAIASQDNELLPLELQNNKALDNSFSAKASENTTPLLSIGKGSGWKDVGMDEDLRKDQMSSAKEVYEGNCSYVDRPLKKRHTHLSVIGFHNQEDAVPCDTHRPHYGWISGEDEEKMSSVKETIDDNFGGVDTPLNGRLTPPVICAPKQVDPVLRQTRRPFHGWIGGEDEEDLVNLRPAPLHDEIAELLYGEAPRRRKKRWDVRSEVMLRLFSVLIFVCRCS